MIFRRGDKDTGRWRQVLAVLESETDYHGRLDALLAKVSEWTGMPACYLYLLADDADRFQLEHSWRATTLDEPESAGLLTGDDVQGGAGATAGSPPMDLPRSGEWETERTTPTPVGRLYSIPLHLEQALIGLLQVGPLDDDKVPRDVERRLETVRFPAALAVKQAYEEDTLRQRLAAATARSEVGRRLLGSALELDRFVDLLLDLALKATRTEAGFIAIVEPGTDELSIRAEEDLPPGFGERVDLSLETGLFDWSPAAEGGALVLRDLDFAAETGMRSVLAVPLLEADEPLGLFALINFGQAETFAEHSLALLATFAEQIKLVLHNARLFRTFAGQYLETVKGLARSLDARRPHTQDHHQRIAQMAATIARAMELPADEAEAIHTAGLIHDVGMAGIVEVEGGFQVDFEHPTIGASLIETLPLHPAVAQSVATHHEWFDGWGFPEGLKGEEIPLGGRILAVVEFIVEMTTSDPLQPSWSRQKLLDELEQRRGTQFDPQVTDVAVDLIRQKRLQVE